MIRIKNPRLKRGVGENNLITGCLRERPTFPIVLFDSV